MSKARGKLDKGVRFKFREAKRAGVTVASLARQAGLSEWTIGKILDGANSDDYERPTLDAAKTWAESDAAKGYGDVRLWTKDAMGLLFAFARSEVLVFERKRPRWSDLVSTEVFRSIRPDAKSTKSAVRSVVACMRRLRKRKRFRPSKHSLELLEVAMGELKLLWKEKQQRVAAQPEETTSQQPRKRKAQPELPSLPTLHLTGPDGRPAHPLYPCHHTPVEEGVLATLERATKALGVAPQRVLVTIEAINGPNVAKICATL